MLKSIGIISRKGVEVSSTFFCVLQPRQLAAHLTEDKVQMHGLAYKKPDLCY